MTDRDAVPSMVSRILDRPTRWAPEGSFLGAYDGAARTLQVFNTAAIDQMRFLDLLEPHRETFERNAGGPVVILFYTEDQSWRHLSKPPDDWKPDEGVVLTEFDARPLPTTRARFFASEVAEGPVRFPVRTDLTVLSPEDPSARTLGFTFRENDGGPVGVPVDGRFHSPLLAREDLWVGRPVLVPTLAGPRQAVVAQEEDGTLYWQADSMVGNLVFDGDERHCWTTSYGIHDSFIKPPTPVAASVMPDRTEPIPESELAALFEPRDTWDKPGRKESP